MVIKKIQLHDDMEGQIFESNGSFGIRLVDLDSNNVVSESIFFLFKSIESAELAIYRKYVWGSDMKDSAFNKGWYYQIEGFDQEELLVCKVQINNFENVQMVKEQIYAAFPAHEGFKIENDLIKLAV